jgi:hypothetical protein
LGRPGVAALLLLVSVIAVFLLHEPIVVLTGGRGGRARRLAGEPTRWRAAALVALALTAGSVGLWLASPTARLGALVPATLGALLVPLIFRRMEKTAVAELLVAATLASTMIPVALASRVEPRTAYAAAIVWAIVFSLGTLTVRAIIARAKRDSRPGWTTNVAPILNAAAIASAAVLALVSAIPAMVALAVIPTALAALIFGLLGIHPRNLRRMGWSLVASNIAVLAALLIGLR